MSSRRWELVLGAGVPKKTPAPSCPGVFVSFQCRQGFGFSKKLNLRRRPCLFLQKRCKQWAKHTVSSEANKDCGCLMQLENVCNMGPLGMGANYRYRLDVPFSQPKHRAPEAHHCTSLAHPEQHHRDRASERPTHTNCSCLRKRLI